MCTNKKKFVDKRKVNYLGSVEKTLRKYKKLNFLKKILKIKEWTPEIIRQEQKQEQDIFLKNILKLKE